MNVYKDMLEVIIRREFALLGRYQTRQILKGIGIDIDERGNIKTSENLGAEQIDEILNEFKKKIGFVGILVVKLPIRRIAIQNNIRVPSPIL